MQSFRYRVENQLEGKEKHIHWKEGFDPIMGWIQEKKKELESIDDLESSIAMLEEASVKFEVQCPLFPFNSRFYDWKLPFSQII